VAMGLTAILWIYSPWGRQSGAHLNPAVTFTYWRLGKIASWDAFFYVMSQFVGGLAAVQVFRVLVRPWISHPAVQYAITTPGPHGVIAAFFAEMGISFLLMLAILLVSNTRQVARYTGLVAGMLVAAYIAIEAPISGMSMNPARTFGSALAARNWTAVWIYFTGPPLGMLLAAELFVRLRGTHALICAKLHHDNKRRCIFRCGYATRAASTPAVAVS
jgi:aquaporin Z